MVCAVCQTECVGYAFPVKIGDKRFKQQIYMCLDCMARQSLTSAVRATIRYVWEAWYEGCREGCREGWRDVRESWQGGWRNVLGKRFVAAMVIGAAFGVCLGLIIS